MSESLNNWWPQIDTWRTDIGIATRKFTGHTSDNDWLALTDRATTRTKLRDALAANKVIVAGTQLSGTGNGIIARHVYTVLAFDPVTDSIQLRDAYGKNEPVNASNQPLDGVRDGIFSITLDALYTNFVAIDYEE